MKHNKLRKISTKLGALFLSIQVICFTFFNSTAFADRAQAEKKLKDEGKAAINAFTNVFQYLGYIVAALALVVVLFGGLLISDDESLKKTKRNGTYVLAIAFIIGVVSSLVTLATNQ